MRRSALATSNGPTMNVLVAGDGVMAVRVVEALMRQHQVTCLHPPDTQSWQLEQLDAEILAGEPTSPQMLEAANVKKADVFIACTRSDERNIVASIAAKRLGASRTVCVLTGQGFLKAGDDGLQLARSLGIDQLVHPIDQLAEEILRIVTVPGALEVVDLAGGKVSLIRFAVARDAPATKQALRDLALPQDTRLVHVRRGDELIVPRGDTQLDPGDKVIAMGFRAGLTRLGPLLLGARRYTERHEATIVGGGRVGRAIAEGLARAKWQVKLIEIDKARCEAISQTVPALVLHGDGADVELLEQERIGDSPVVITVTNSDEKNLLIALLVKQLGNPRLVTRADRLSNERMFEKVGVDVVRSATGAAIRRILTQVDARESEIHAELEHGEACVLELTVPDDAPTLRFEHLRAPAYSVVGAVLRGGKAIIPSGQDTLRAGDHLFVFCARKDEEVIREYYTDPRGRSEDS